MTISLLLEMAASADPDRVAVVSGDIRLTAGELAELAGRGGGVIDSSGCAHVAYLGVGGAALSLLLFSSAAAGRPFTPLNYRLAPESIAALVDRLPAPLLVADPEYREIAVATGKPVIDTTEFRSKCSGAAHILCATEPDDVGIVLFTSGTTAQPKAVELKHSNLTSYVMGTVEFGSAEPDERALVCVPPYHIAGVSAALSHIFAGRPAVYLTAFDPEAWVRVVEEESITTATVVPTMLDRIVKVLEAGRYSLPSLRTLAYGGSKVGLPLIRKAMTLLPNVGFVNAYGLTETSSTIAVLTPDDHRAAYAGQDEPIRRRLGSVGQPVPGVEVQIRGEAGVVLGAGEPGELFVRGSQVSGRYAGVGSVLDEDGWFPTRDIAFLDESGYLFLGGRSDDTIIRGGENIAPAEIEDVLIEHPAVDQVVVVGALHPEWGQELVAVVVPAADHPPSGEAELKDYVRDRLRGSRTPDRVVFLAELPTSPTGKILRREIVSQITLTPPGPAQRD